MDTSIQIAPEVISLSLRDDQSVPSPDRPTASPDAAPPISPQRDAVLPEETEPESEPDQDEDGEIEVDADGDDLARLAAARRRAPPSTRAPGGPPVSQTAPAPPVKRSPATEYAGVLDQLDAFLAKFEQVEGVMARGERNAAEPPPAAGAVTWHGDSAWTVQLFDASLQPDVRPSKPKQLLKKPAPPAAAPVRNYPLEETQPDPMPTTVAAPPEPEASVVATPADDPPQPVPITEVSMGAEPQPSLIHTYQARTAVDPYLATSAHAVFTFQRGMPETEADPPPEAAALANTSHTPPPQPPVQRSSTPVRWQATTTQIIVHEGSVIRRSDPGRRTQ